MSPTEKVLYLFSYTRGRRYFFRARGVVGYHARLARLQGICERGPVQSRTCPLFFTLEVWFSSSL